MFTHDSGRGRRAVAWTASLALASVSVTGLVLAPAAGAASSHRVGATGFVEVCKQAADHFTHGMTVRLTITAGDFRDVETVLVGQCTGAIRVPAGQVTIAEKAASPTYLKAVKTVPKSALISRTATSATVKVAPSRDQSRETLVTMWNAAQLGFLKVCKTLTANSASLIAQGNSTFWFGVWFLHPGSTSWSPLGRMHVTVLQTGKMTCALFPFKLPLGLLIKVLEVPHSGSMLTGVHVLPASQDAGSMRHTALLKIGPFRNSVVTAAFTNMAVGTIEICKTMDDSNWAPGRPGPSPYNGTPFLFSVNHGHPIIVKAGGCSGAIPVPAGTATVQELVPPNFHLLGWTAVGPDDSSRLIGSATANPIKVSVPAGGVGNETLVTATDQVNVGRVKVCKILNGPKVGYDYTFTTWYSFGARPWTVTLHPTGQGVAGQDCSGLGVPVPVVDPRGHPVWFRTTEGKSPFVHDIHGNPTVEPTQIRYAGNGHVIEVRAWRPGDTNAQDGTYHLTAFLGQGVNVVTFVNSFVIDP